MLMTLNMIPSRLLSVSLSSSLVDAAGVDDGSAADFSAPKNNSNAERLSALKESVVTGASHTWGAVRSAASALPSNLNIKWRNENAPLDVDGEVELPVGMISWQLLLSVGWGPYLCLPVESGHYASRNQLASMLQRLLQSTVRDDEGITWVVSVDKEDGKVVFALQQGEGLGGKKSTGSVSGFRIAPSADLCAILRVTLGTDGWLSSHLSKDGTITTHPLSLSLPPSLPPSATPIFSNPDADPPIKVASRTPLFSWPSSTSEAISKQGESKGGGGGGSIGGWAGGIMKSFTHPIASFGVSLATVVRREACVAASLQKQSGDRLVPQPRPPIVLENILLSLNKALAPLLPKQQQDGGLARGGAAGSDPLVDEHSLPRDLSDLLLFLPSPTVEGRVAHLKTTLDDSPAAQIAATPPHILFELLREFLLDMPEPLIPPQHSRLVLGASQSSFDLAMGGVSSEAGEQELCFTLRGILSGLPGANWVTCRRLLIFLNFFCSHVKEGAEKARGGANASGGGGEKAGGGREVGWERVRVWGADLERHALPRNSPALARRKLSQAFGPAIVRPSDHPAEVGVLVPQICWTVSLLIKHAETLFFETAPPQQLLEST